MIFVMKSIAKFWLCLRPSMKHNIKLVWVNFIKFIPDIKKHIVKYIQETKR